MHKDIFSLETTNIERNSLIGQRLIDDVKTALKGNDAVGIIAGYYDDKLSIFTVSEYLLHDLGYTREGLAEFTNNSLRNLFYGENKEFLAPDRFPLIEGLGEGDMITSDGTPISARIFKKDSYDANGTRMWILSVRIDWERVNIFLINEAIDSGNWYVDYDTDNNMTEVSYSHAFRKMLGYHDVLDFPNEVESWAKMVHPSDKGETLRLMREAVTDRTNDTKFDAEFRMRMQDGDYVWFRAVGEITRRRDGSARRIAGILVNVNEEKLASMRKQREAAFHRAFTHINLCEYYIDLEEGIAEKLKEEPHVKKALRECHTWDDMARRYVDEFVLDEYKEQVLSFANREFLMGKLTDLDVRFTMEYQVNIAGEVKWVRNIMMPGDVGNLKYAMVFIRDVTEAKKDTANKNRLVKEHHEIQNLIGSMTRMVDYYCIGDLVNDEYTFVSEKEEGKYPANGKYSDCGQLIAKNHKTMNNAETLETIFSIAKCRENIKNEDDIYRFEYCTLDESVYMMATLIPLEWEDGVLTKIIWVSMDITDDKKQEIRARKALNDAYLAAERANVAKTEFLSNMSHDIRTPMNAIMGLTTIAVNNIDNQDKIAECLTKITASSNHLLGLINEVLDMARIESGKIMLADEDFKISELTDNIVSLTKSAIDEHSHNLTVNTENIIHDDVRGDSMRIQQVVTNIMSNSIKYTQDGGNIIFSIKEKQSETSNQGCYELTVSDNGMGIDPEFQKIMFQPFTRVDNQRTSKIQGTGLGLAIVRNIVDMMNGNIEVDSVTGLGTNIKITIYLDLQAGMARENSEFTHDGMRELSQRDYTNKRVLLVEDNELNSEIVAEILKRTGMKIDVAWDGSEALDKVASAPDDWYDLIFMDIKMPVMNGYEATAAIRTLSGSKGKVPIVAMTANAFAEDVQLAKDAGMNGHIAKPLDMAKLNDVLEKWLN